MLANLNSCIDGTNISGELDVLDDGKTSVGCMSNIEALIVDNVETEKKAGKVMRKCGNKCDIFVNSLPRFIALSKNYVIVEI